MDILTHNDPVLDAVECLLVKEQVFQPGQWAICIHSTTLLEDVAVAHEVVTRSTYKHIKEQSCGLEEGGGAMRQARGASNTKLESIITREGYVPMTLILDIKYTLCF